MLSNKPEIIHADTLDHESIKLLEETICNEVVNCEELIACSNSGFNNRISNISAHDISLELKKDDEGSTYIHFSSIHYIDELHVNCFKTDINVKKIVLIGNSIVLEDYKKLNKITLAFYEKPITELVRYYTNFYDLKVHIFDKLQDLLNAKGELFLYSDTPFYPQYFSDGELTMKPSVLFKDIDTIDINLIQVNNDQESLPGYNMHFDITVRDPDVNGKMIHRSEFDIDRIMNISVYPKKIILYRSIGMPVYVNLVYGGGHQRGRRK